MLDVRNHTPLNTMLIPGLDKNGYDYAIVVIKGNFTINADKKLLILSEEPATIFEGDEYYGEPGESSVRYESDTSMYKRGTDIVANGHAYAPAGKQASSVDIGLQVGSQSKICKVFGDRFWEKAADSVMTWQASAPKHFKRMPIIYENAFGGIDRKTPKDEIPDYSASNPIGKGFVGHKSSPVEGLALPNIEDPRSLIQKWEDKPTPAGFGFLNRAWQPRLSMAGTFDEQWMTQRKPLLPLDFNDQYFNGAHPDMISTQILKGGEHVILNNMSESGRIEFDLPAWKETVDVSIKGNKQTFNPVMDTVVIEPDNQNVMITWRVTVPCYKQLLYLDSVTIGKKR